MAVLTDQERGLPDLLGEGSTNRRIAQRMFPAKETVKHYVSRLLTEPGPGAAHPGSGLGPWPAAALAAVREQRRRPISRQHRPRRVAERVAAE
ncbi:LuxR C-terminal-related transcriptional regulator [Nocardia asteroides]